MIFRKREEPLREEGLLCWISLNKIQNRRNYAIQFLQEYKVFINNMLYLFY